MRWTERLFQPVDIASLVAFRIAFGAVLILHTAKHVTEPSFYFTAALPSIHLPYPGLAWVRPVSENGMQVILVLMLIGAWGITLGLAYRLSCVVYTLGAAYFHCMDAARFYNHYYLVLLVTFLMIFIPAHGALSADAWMRRSVRRSTTHRWTVWLLRFQLGIPYFFSGISKLNFEWLHGTPAIFFWYSFIIEHAWAREWNPVPIALFIAWGGALADTFLIPLLLWRVTRPAGFVMALIFNLGNAALFSGPLYQVEMFPWFMLGALTLYLDPDWPRRLADRLLRHRSDTSAPVPPVPPAGPRPFSQRLAPGLLGLYVLVQVLVPLRYLLYPGQHLWTEFGRTHAWQMMGARKMARTTFIVTDPATGETWERTPVGALDGDRVQAVMRKPYLIHRYALYLRDDMARLGHPNVEVRAESFAGLNGRPMQRMIDPTVDLTRAPGRWGYYSWVLPLTEPPVPLRDLDFYSSHPMFGESFKE